MKKEPISFRWPNFFSKIPLCYQSTLTFSSTKMSKIQKPFQKFLKNMNCIRENLNIKNNIYTKFWLIIQCLYITIISIRYLKNYKNIYTHNIKVKIKENKILQRLKMNKMGGGLLGMDERIIVMGEVSGDGIRQQIGK